MRFTGLIILIIFFSYSSFLQAQSFYTIDYRFDSKSDSNKYFAFLQRNDDGSGLIRIRFAGTNPDEVNLVQAFIDEQYPLGKDEEPDTTLLLIKAINPVFIQKDNSSSFTPPVFVFRYKKGTGVFEPAGVTDDVNSQPVKNPLSVSWQFLGEIQLTKDLVGTYFNEDDPFYVNLFRSGATKGFSKAETNFKMQLIIVADTIDPKIGKAVALDVNRVTELFSSVCKYLGVKLFTTVLVGAAFGKASTQAAINKLKADPNDVVIFYYSGHGFRMPEKPRPYPNMKLKNVKTKREAFSDSLAWAKASRTANISQSLNIEDVFKSITAKGARMNLVISDCCNDDIFSVNMQLPKPSGTKSSGIQWSEENVRALFLNKTPLSVLATACTETETSASQDDFGSFFTYFLKTSLEGHCSKLKSNVSWDMVLKQAMSQTTIKASNTYCSKPRIPANLCKQHPVYKIDIGKPRLTIR
jgi:hypothetical protein